MFPTGRFVLADDPPEPSMIANSIRSSDKGGTNDGGALTAGVPLHKLRDGRYCVAHCRRGQWKALDRERKVRQIAELDGKSIRVDRRGTLCRVLRGHCPSFWFGRVGWGMKGVDTIARVRREYLVRGRSIREIARELHISRNTVRKMSGRGRRGEMLFDHRGTCFQSAHASA